MRGYIYKLSFTGTDRVYIGQTYTSLEQRLKSHLQLLNTGKHPIEQMQSDYSSGIISKPVMEVLEETERRLLSEREGDFIDIHKDNCYNRFFPQNKGIYPKLAYQISTDDAKSLKVMAIDADLTLKPFVEAQLIAMAKCKVSYVDLWASNQALADALEQLRAQA